VILLAVFTLIIEQVIDASFLFYLYFFIGFLVIIPLATVLTDYNPKKNKNNQNKKGRE